VVAARQVGNLAAGDVGQAADLVAPKLGVVQQAGQQDQLGQGRGHVKLLAPSPEGKRGNKKGALESAPFVSLT
jgi:hypothetical protein